MLESTRRMLETGVCLVPCTNYADNVRGSGTAEMRYHRNLRAVFALCPQRKGALEPPLGEF